MATPTPIFTAAMFADVRALAPRIGRGTQPATGPADADAPIDVYLSDGTTQRIADTKLTLLKLMESCRRRGQSFVAASEDVSIFWAGFHKGFIVENTLQNQRLFASYAVTYDAGRTRWVSRSLASYVTTADAMTAVGLTVRGQLQSNADFDRERLPFRIFDWNYKSQVTAQQPGSVLDDNATGQIIYDWDNLTYV